MMRNIQMLLNNMSVKRPLVSTYSQGFVLKRREFICIVRYMWKIRSVLHCESKSRESKEGWGSTPATPL